MTTIQQALIRSTYYAAHRAVRITQSPQSAHTDRFRPFPLQARQAATKAWVYGLPECAPVPLSLQNRVMRRRIQSWFR